MLTGKINNSGSIVIPSSSGNFEFSDENVPGINSEQDEVFLIILHTSKHFAISSLQKKFRSYCTI